MALTTHHPLTVTEAIAARRSVRSFTRDGISRDTIRLLLAAAVQAPTALHAEPWAFVVIQDPALLSAISRQAKSSWIKETAHYKDLHAKGLGERAAEYLHTLERDDFNIFYDAPALIVICGRPLSPFVFADCWLAAGNLMLAACARGLGTCCIGSAVPILNAPDVKRELGIPSDVSAVAPIIVGVPADEAAAVSRKPPEILTWK